MAAPPPPLQQHTTILPSEDYKETYLNHPSALELTNHRLNIELGLQKLFGLLCTLYSCTYWLRPPQLPPPPSPAFGLIYEGAIGQPR